MNRRGFVETIRNAVSGSFVLGCAGGAATGAAAVLYHERAEHPERSFAQQGEDVVAMGILGVLGITKPTYLDVGAFDPTVHSNTYLAYLAGGHGVLVEPNPAKIRRLERVRPRDRTLNIGIGFTAEPSTADYYIIGGPAEGLFNTFSKQDAELLNAGSGGKHFIEKVVKMPLENINTVMERDLGGAPDFLSVDTEGMDLDILKTMDFTRHRPAVICVETLELGTDHVDVGLIRFLEAQRYSVRGATWINTLFVDDKRLSEPGPLASPPRAKG